MYLGHSTLETKQPYRKGTESNGLMWFIPLLGHQGHWSSVSKNAHVHCLSLRGVFPASCSICTWETQSKLKWHQYIIVVFLLHFLSWTLKVRGTEYESEAPGRLEVNSLAGDLSIFHTSYPFGQRNEETLRNFVTGMKVISLNLLLLPSIVNLNDYHL